MTWTDGRAEFERLRDQAETVACPYCHVIADERCLNTVTREPVRNIPAHPARIVESETESSQGGNRA